MSFLSSMLRIKRVITLLSALNGEYAMLLVSRTCPCFRSRPPACMYASQVRLYQRYAALFRLVLVFQMILKTCFRSASLGLIYCFHMQRFRGPLEIGRIRRLCISGIRHLDVIFCLNLPSARHRALGKPSAWREYRMLVPR